MSRFQINIGGAWKDYAADEDKILKMLAAKGRNPARITLRGQKYEFDFEAFEQRNLESGKVRSIRLPRAPAALAEPPAIAAASPAQALVEPPGGSAVPSSVAPPRRPVRAPAAHAALATVNEGEAAASVALAPVPAVPLAMAALPEVPLGTVARPSVLRDAFAAAVAAQRAECAERIEQVPLPLSPRPPSPCSAAPCAMVAEASVAVEEHVLATELPLGKMHMAPPPRVAAPPAAAAAPPAATAAPPAATAAPPAAAEIKLTLEKSAPPTSALAALAPLADPLVLGVAAPAASAVGVPAPLAAPDPLAEPAPLAAAPALLVVPAPFVAPSVLAMPTPPASALAVTAPLLVPSVFATSTSPAVAAALGFEELLGKAQLEDELLALEEQLGAVPAAGGA